jgi:two-component system phosphate regulon sensor histidine kinase PhoR
VFIAAAAVLVAVREYLRRAKLESQQQDLDWQNIALRRSLSQLSVGFVLLGGDDAVRFQNVVADDLLGETSASYWGGAHHKKLVAFLQQSKGQASGNREIEISNDEGKSLVNAIVLEIDNEFRVLLLQNLEAEALAHLRLREFVANASHELKTPIAAIIGMLDLLPHMTSEKQTDLTERLQRNANSLAILVDDLLTLSRAESSASPFTPVACDAIELANRVIEQFKLKANYRSLSLELEAPSKLMVVADELALSRVLSNLVENALAYTDKGSVVVRLADHSSLWSIEVEDSGPGIAAEHIPRLFQRFFRIDAARSRALGGTGLGLSIVRNFVERMDGAITVESTIGKGSIFRVELPKS